MIIDPYRYVVAGGGDFDNTGLLWRVRASDITGLVDDDPVTTWDDSSGNNRDWTGSGVTRPRYRTNVINGHPALRFFQSSDHSELQGPDLSGLGLTEADVFLLVKALADPPGSEPNSGLWTLNSADYVNASTHYPWSDSIIYQSAFLPSTTRPSVNPTPSLAAWRLLRVTAKTGTDNYKMDLDGTNIAMATKATLQFPATTNLGRSYTSGSQYNFKGDVAEFFCFSTKRDATQTTEIRDYLNTYYALSIA